MSDAHDPVESYSIQLRKGAYIDLFLYRADKPEKGSFIKLTLYKDGKKNDVFLKKDTASFLCMQLQFLIQKGLELDMVALQKKYPDQKTWHIK